MKIPDYSPDKNPKYSKEEYSLNEESDESDFFNPRDNRRKEDFLID